MLQKHLKLYESPEIRVRNLALQANLLQASSTLDVTYEEEDL